MRSRRTVLAALTALAGSPFPALAQGVSNRELLMQVEAKIPLGEVRGRIDHLAVDLARRRLFIAELGNDSLGVVDLDARSVAHRIRGLREPQGVAYLPEADVLLAANGGDGTVERFRGVDLAPLGRASLGADADNLRPDPTGGGVVWVGHGGAWPRTGGGLTPIDAQSGRPVGAAIPLPAHPESFQLEAGGPRIFANIPRAGGVVVVLDRAARQQVASWSVPRLGSNFPMALDERGGRLFVAFRDPPTLATLDLGTGSVIGQLAMCGDADDLFLDARRHRLYAVCGEGAVDVFDASPPSDGRATAPRHLARVPTSPGARTGLFVPEFDRLFVAARAQAGEPAALWVLRPDAPP